MFTNRVVRSFSLLVIIMCLAYLGYFFTVKAKIAEVSEYISIGTQIATAGELVVKQVFDFGPDKLVTETVTRSDGRVTTEYYWMCQDGRQEFWAANFGYLPDDYALRYKIRQAVLTRDEIYYLTLTGVHSGPNFCKAN